MLNLCTCEAHLSKQSRSINQSMEFTVLVGEPDVTHRTSKNKVRVNVVGDQRHLVSIALQKEANATLVGPNKALCCCLEEDGGHKVF